MKFIELADNHTGSYPETYGPYKLKYPCFNCRKCFKPHKSLPRRDVMRCPQCGDMLRAYSFYFKAPPHNDVRAWKVLQEDNRPQGRWAIDSFDLPQTTQRYQYDPRVYQAIYEAVDDLNSPIHSKRHIAHETLLRIGRPALFPLIEILQKAGSEFPPNAEHIIEVLGDYRDNLATLPIVHALRTGPDHIRLAAVIALGKMRSQKAIPEIVDCFRSPLADKQANRQLQTAARKALSQIGGVNILIPLLQDEDSAVRAAVVEALSKSRVDNLPSDILRKIWPLLSDRSPEVQREAEFAMRGLRKFKRFV